MSYTCVDCPHLQKDSYETKERKLVVWHCGKTNRPTPATTAKHPFVPYSSCVALTEQPRAKPKHTPNWCPLRRADSLRT